MLSPVTLRWQLHTGNPLIRPPFPSPVIADPTFSFPEDSPDGRWHLYAHSVRGIHHYTSEDGIMWQRREMVVKGALRPFLFKEAGVYYLFYEKIIALGILPFSKNKRWHSILAVRSSTDFLHWSDEQEVLRPVLSWHSDEQLGMAVSNPCLVKTATGYRLYYSASLVYVPDCGFNEPKYIGYAEGSMPMGPFVPASEPIFSPSADPWINLGAGSVKVVKGEDNYWAFQNGIYIRADNGHSGSAVLLWRSEDGVTWKRALVEPLIQPRKGWMSSHVYALDARFRAAENKWYLYFNARRGYHWTRGVERIGLMTGIE
jgi:hypothetical protein